MVTATVSLGSIEQVKKFADIARSYPYDIDLAQGLYRVTGKSIMGILCLNLEYPLNLLVDNDEAAEFLARIAPFLCKF